MVMACVQQGALPLPVTNAQGSQPRWPLLCFRDYECFSPSALMTRARTPSQLCLIRKREERVGRADPAGPAAA